MFVAVFFWASYHRLSAEDTPGKPLISQDVVRRLDEVQQYVQSLQSFSFQLELATETTIGDEVKRKPWRSLSVQFQRPKKLLLRAEHQTYACDGKVIWFLAPSLAGKPTYIKKPSASSFQDIAKDDCFTFVARHASQLLASMLNGDKMSQTMLANVHEASMQSGDTSDFLTLVGNKVEQKLLFTNRFPAELRVTRSSADFMLPSSLTANFSEWVVNAQFEEKSFAVQIPRDAKRIQSLEEFFDIKRPEGPDPLIGKAAPIFALDSVDSDNINLDIYLGKQVTVVNFWSTWAGPVAMTLPIFERLREDFEKRGIVFIAVNVREDRDVVGEFVKKSNRDFGVVVFDTDGDIANAYGITGFPQSFVIGKDGKVRAVFRGFSSDLEQKFKAELEKALNTNAVWEVSSSVPMIPRWERTCQRHMESLRTTPMEIGMAMADIPTRKIPSDIHN